MTTAFTITQKAELKRLAEQGNERFYRVFKEIYRGGKYSNLNSTKAFEQLVRYAPLGPSIPRVSDKMRATPQLVSLAPRALTFRHESFRAAYSYLWEDLQDDKWGFFREQARGLGELMDYTLELLGHEAFNRFNDTAFPGGWDNLPLGHASHQLLNGGTYSNLVAAAAPSETLYENILNAFDAIPDDHGRLSKVTGYRFVTHTTRFRAWTQLFRTPVTITQAPGAATTTPQPNPQIPQRYDAEFAGTRITGTPYLNNHTQVVVLGDDHELVWFDRLEPSQRIYERDDPPALTHRLWYKGSRGWMDARRIVIVQPS